MAKAEKLFEPLTIGRYVMPNRFVMSALTRCRATDQHIPTDAMVKYYSDRAGFGLILTEATQIQDGYSAFAYEAGIFGKLQIEGWRTVTDAVHKRKGLIFCQIFHPGRAAPQCNLAKGLKVSGASELGILNHQCPAAFRLDGKAHSYEAHPHMLTLPEIKQHVELFVTAARNAIQAGFDGVEIHSANGYLIDQFLKSGSNNRTDKYGGSIENRCRFLLEVLDGVIAAIGHDRVGVRISPLNGYNDQKDDDPKALTQYLCGKLNERNIAFLDVMRGDFFTPARGADKWAREVFKGVLFSGMGYEIEEAEREVANKEVDGVVFGVKAIANPDLVARVAAGFELQVPNPATFYTRGEEGYIDYPTMEEVQARK